MREQISLLFFKVSFWINCLEMNSVFFPENGFQKTLQEKLFEEEAVAQT